LIQAISNPTKKVALVIEEINRGNAPAIFGDIFQLLDRDENGISEYGIVNVSMMDYLNAYEFTVDGEKKRYTFSEIKIPGNMDIFATMNTSDQNVYTLDTAFVRRWDKEKIRNSFKNCTFKAMPIPGMPQYTWEEFVTSINKCIAGHLEDLQVNEDKQIGAFFVKESLLASKDAEKFAYKVFDYLWSDVAKLDHGIFFNHFDTLESLIDAYKKNGVGVFKTGIFEAKAAVSAEEEENNE
jgi:5-methylcytosine-specific restriction endonuclease McrBC GTP-binding regulatory subunit McrB